MKLIAQIKEDMQLLALKRMQQEPVSVRSQFAGIPLQATNFSSIKAIRPEKPMLFVDGGNAVLVDAPDYSLQFFRFGAIEFTGKKKTFSERKQGYVLCSAQHVDSKLAYTAQCYGDLSGSFTLSADDPLLQGIEERTRVQAFGNIFRCIMEIQFATEVMRSGVLVLDRSLLAANPYERQVFEKLFVVAKEKRVDVVGVAKTTGLLCTNGESVVTALDKFHFPGKWLYTPVFVGKDVSFVKLHEHSKYIFRYEGSREIASWLAYLSGDPVFLGYPYGLVAVDKYARVSNREKEILGVLFDEKGAYALSAHSVLDSI